MAIKINIGDTVVCTHAASTWFTKGKTYQVVKHPEHDGNCVVAADGIHDLLCMTISTFEKIKTDG